MKSLIKAIRNFLFFPLVLSDYFLFRSKDTTPRFNLSLKHIYPQIFDKTLKTGFDRHYIYHIAWAIRVVKELGSKMHIDIGSSLHFSTTLSAFIPVKFYDYRPAPLDLDGLESAHADLTNLSFQANSINSLSCLHTIEHVGLGRYGDPIDPQGDIKACKELSRVLAKDGSLLFVTPVGNRAIIEFNAHRIYTYEQVLGLFPDLTLKEFSLIPEHADKGGLIRNANPAMLADERYACGCFLFKK